MATSLKDLEKTVNSALTTVIKKSEINFNQLYITISIDDLISTVLFLKTNDKCRFRQLIDITTVDYPKREKRFKMVYLLLSLEKNLRIIICMFSTLSCIIMDCSAQFFGGLKYAIEQCPALPSHLI